ncbi:hypothetical protein EW145_g8235, partial [Phellinidium pouzarii]
MSKGTILARAVTGGSGFVGAHTIALLLAEGYSVRAVARGGAKVDYLRNAFAGEAVEVVEIRDIAKDDLTPIFTGVNGIIHSASPLAGRAPAQETVDSTVEGALNVLRCALKSGVTKVVMTSSFGALLNRWGEVTTEELLDGSHDLLYVYLGAKTVAEKAAWKFAEENPALDLATSKTNRRLALYLLLILTYTPPLPRKSSHLRFTAPSSRARPPASPAELGTNRLVFALIT